MRKLRIFLLALSCVVHCLPVAGVPMANAGKVKGGAQSSTGGAPKGPVVNKGGAHLPAPVEEMRESILAAVRSGNIEELRYAFELNEMKPELGPGFGPGAMSDPIAYWRKMSGDGEGREILAALGTILEMECAVLPLGRDVENNKVYVWPYLAELAPAKLTPAQQVDLLRLVTPAAAAAMKAAGKYNSWRLVIGADGTWHSFVRGP